MKVSLLKFDDRIPRECGECQACCSIVGVKELNKETYTKCQHQCETGCSIHGNHPEECKQYWCLWKEGFLEGDVRRRPDKLGILFDYRHFGRDSLQVWEVWKDSFEQENVKYVLAKLRKVFLIVMRYFERPNHIGIMGPRNLVDAFLMKYKPKNVTIV